ncbi:cysteine-rich CWC family protein [Runella sp.]|uniref:cysteine-rich CWC family protein n=1 Tax=Runella sp. TaxID=1960881 RepID=UPI003D14B3CF
MEKPATYSPHQCPRCQRSFECKPFLSAQCACFQFAIPSQVALFIKTTYDGCLCPTCLTELINEPISSNPSLNHDVKELSQ